MIGIHLGLMNLLQIKSNRKTKFMKIISRMEEQKNYYFKIRSTVNAVSVNY